MNKFINTVLFVFAFLTFLFVVIVGRDMPISFLRTTGQYMPYKNVIFIVIATIFLVIGGRRSAQRWMGIHLVKHTEKYQWNVPVGKRRTNRSIFYLFMEAFSHWILAGLYLFFTKDALPVTFALFVLGLDHLFFAYFGGKRNAFRVGITKSALVIADREVKILYFTGLRQVSVQQNTIYFEYIQDLVIDFPENVIPEDKHEEFKEELKKVINLKKVYLPESFKNY